MGIFGFLQRDKIENENRTKPFHKNRDASERKEWFSKTRPWHKVDPAVIDVLIQKLGDNPMFEVFVITSMNRGLVQQYENLKDMVSNTDPGPEIVCSLISRILFKSGAAASSNVDQMVRSGRINENNLSKQYTAAVDSHETAIILEPNQIDSYVQLAALNGTANKFREAIDYIDQGLTAIRRIREMKAPFEMSGIEEIQNFPEHLENTEQLLTRLKRDFLESQEG